MSPTTEAVPASQPRRVLLTVHTGRRDIIALARSSAARLQAGGIVVRLLENEDGELRGMLYLDEPLSGLRPTPDAVAAINAEAGVLFEAVISIVERELYGEQVRMVTQARRAIASVRPGLGVEELTVSVRSCGRARKICSARTPYRSVALAVICRRVSSPWSSNGMS